MAGPALTRSPTCLSCLRRLTTTGGGTKHFPSPVSGLQTRGKRTGRPRDQGAVVRLLEDIPTFGHRGAVFRTERGRMRNVWYPHKKAEYMTANRFQELGMTRADIGERDALFQAAPALPGRESKVDTEAEAKAELAEPVVQIHHVPATRAHSLIETLVPQTITFYRKPIEPLPPSSDPLATRTVPSRSPLIATKNSLMVPEPQVLAHDPLAIFGSVSPSDIVADIKRRMANDVESSRIALEPHHVRFVGVDTDRLKALGHWQIEISLANVNPGGKNLVVLEPVRKTVEILAEETSMAEQPMTE